MDGEIRGRGGKAKNINQSGCDANIINDFFSVDLIILVLVLSFLLK